jgi:signal transduction histidine kinase
MGTDRTPAAPPRWELAAEKITVRIRWFGVLLGAAYVNLGAADGQRLVLNAILAVGAAFTVLDTWYSLRGRVFLGPYPLFISAMESLFIGVLCLSDGKVDSPFRYYYLLSLICCAIRYSRQTTVMTCLLHGLSYGLLHLVLPTDGKEPFVLTLTLVVLGWVAWASSDLALLLKRAGEHLTRLNAALQENQALLEDRIAERTRLLQETQAQLLHQEKMAAFGLLAAGIAHEVGNPLTSISSLVQMLQRRDCDDYFRERLGLVGGELQRIRTILRELITFSRPASTERTRVSLAEVVDEALGIAKYYQGGKSRKITAAVPADLPLLVGVRGQLVQTVLNLVLNAIDATAKGGRVEIAAERRGAELALTVRDDGPGIPPEYAGRLFTPYFTTKKHGTGLGLFVTRKLVTGHGGELEFESAPGQGALFRVRLPVGADA